MDKGRGNSLRYNKTAVRDVSDVIGKVPPSAVELEETVLGALMLESHSYELVKDILHPNHFYTGPHQEIYTAIVDLRSENAPIDFRFVINQLRKTGKLELVGGPSFVVALTTNVSSSENIEHHARVVVEMALKRELIKAASGIHQQAYEDTTDVFELIDFIRDQIDQIKSKNVSEPKEAKIKSLWKDILLEEDPGEDHHVMFLNGTPIGSLGNHSLVIGKKKSRKTLFLTMLISNYLKSPGTDEKEIIFFDTEQGKSHVYKIRKKVEQMTGKKIPVLYLRGRSPAERREIIENTILFWDTPVRVAFIDGVRDLLSNINDIDEVTDFIVWLEKLTLQHNIHICDVLHMNKGDNNARGHLGTELANKAQTSIELELDEQAGLTKVKCESSRDEPFAPFAFTHDKDKLPMIVGMPNQQGESLAPNDEQNRIRIIFEDGQLSYMEMIDAIKSQFELGTTRAKQLAAKWQREGWVVKSGISRSKDTKYSLITKNFTKLEDLHPPVQQEIFNEPPSTDLPF